MNNDENIEYLYSIIADEIGLYNDYVSNRQIAAMNNLYRVLLNCSGEEKIIW